MRARRRVVLAWLLFFPAWFIVIAWGMFLALPDATTLGYLLAMYAMGATSAAFSLAIVYVVKGGEVP